MLVITIIPYYFMFLVFHILDVYNNINYYCFSTLYLFILVSWYNVIRLNMLGQKKNWPIEHNNGDLRLYCL